MLYVVSLGAPKAIDAPAYVRQTAESQGRQSQTLIDDLEYLAQHENAVYAADRNGDHDNALKLKSESFLAMLELACWDSNVIQPASIQWFGGGESNTDYYRNCVLFDQLVEEATRGKPEPKPQKAGEPLNADRVHLLNHTEPLAMRWIRIEGGLIREVAQLFLEDTDA